MNANVVIAYPGFGDIEIEREILSAAGLEIEHVGNLDTEEAREAARQCDALMVHYPAGAGGTHPEPGTLSSDLPRLARDWTPSKSRPPRSGASG